MPEIKMKTIEKISTNIGKIEVSIAGINEHLKNLNGTVARHEKSIGELYNENKQQFVSIAKITGIGIAAGTAGGLIVSSLISIFA